MRQALRDNSTPSAILLHVLQAIVSLFCNGFGIYLIIRADIGVSPWDVLSIGLSKTLGILYGNANVAVSFSILAMDVLMREPIGIAIFIDAIVVGKSVDFFQYLDLVPAPKSVAVSILLLVLGMVEIGYTQYFYMRASLGCGPRDTLLVGLSKRMKKIPIGVVSVLVLAVVTLSGYLLGGPVGIGTLLCAFGLGPVMQFAFMTMHFDATAIRHQNLRQSLEVFLSRKGEKTH